MYQCPGCGGNLVFDIEHQMLKCKYCNEKINPYSVEKEEDAQLNEFFEIKIFSCPQCGGEIYSVENEAASFCTYCGASAILSERISKEKRPDKIITFKVTKEDCKRLYKATMKKAWFAPSKLKNSEFIDGFRGIYMPYWNYSVSQNGNIAVPAQKSHRSGDYIITDHYTIRGELESEFSNDVHDASSSFYDEISEALAPYDIGESAEFTPSFLSGFYADSADVDKNVYLDSTIEFAEKRNLERIRTSVKTDVCIETDKNKVKWPETKVESIQSAMFPVWFLSYRRKDRVAYATVNGQTGKVVADIPISPIKYIIASLIMAIPIFLVLNLIAVFMPTTLLGICMLLLLITSVICNLEVRKISKKENNVNDKGLIWKKKKNVLGVSNEGKFVVKKILIIVGICFMLPFIFAFMGMLNDLIIFPAAIVTILFFINTQKNKKNIEKTGAPIGMIISVIVSIVVCLISLINPVYDIWWYGGTIAVLVAILVNFILIIKYYNRIAMRRLPQFDKKGGDDSAY